MRSEPVRRPNGVMMSAFASAIIGLLLILTLGGCGDRSDEILELSGPTMGTYYSVKVARPPGALDREALQQGIEGVLDKVIGLISTYDSASELSRFNRDPSTDWMAVSPELLMLFQEAFRISALLRRMWSRFSRRLLLPRGAVMRSA